MYTRTFFRKEIQMKKLLSILFLTCSCFSFAEYRISWEAVGELPAQKSYEKNIGTAGLLQGMIGDYIIVGGGANFPIKPLTEGGSKVTHKRSEEHTSELQSRQYLVCRLLLEKKNTQPTLTPSHAEFFRQFDMREYVLSFPHPLPSSESPPGLSLRYA